MTGLSYSVRRLTATFQTDTYLWQLLKQSDQVAFAQLYQRYYQTLYSYGYKVAADADVVEDAIQEVFITLWRLRQTLADADSVKFYLFRSLRRQIRHLREKQQRYNALLPSFVTASQPAPDQPLIELEQEEQLTRRLTQLLQELPQRQLEVVVLRYYENFKTDQIAAIMGITEKSVRNTLHKALTHLRQQAQYLAPFLGWLMLWLMT